MESPHEIKKSVSALTDTSARRLDANTWVVERESVLTLETPEMMHLPDSNVPAINGHNNVPRSTIQDTVK